MNRKERREMMKKFDPEEVSKKLTEHLQEKYPGIKVGISMREVPLDEIEDTIEENKRGITPEGKLQ